jgi:hypothetical protein
MGFEIPHASKILGEACYRAEGANLVLTAADTLQLLGLAVLAERRGNNACQATDAEVEALLLLEGAVSRWSTGSNPLTCQESSVPTVRIRQTFIVSSAFLAGAAAAAAVLYVAYQPVGRFVASAPFVSAASTGELYVRTLRDLRNSETTKAVQRLEIMLDSEIMTLSAYEEAIPADERDKAIYGAAAIMREYRREVPSASKDPEVLRVLDKGLRLSLED